MQVEIVKYKELGKGALKAFFDVVIQPGSLRINDCRYFVKGDSWFKLPEKEVKSKDGTKTDYFPILRFLDPDYLAEFTEAVLTELEKQGKPASDDIPF